MQAKLSKELVKTRALPVLRKLEGDAGVVMVQEMAMKLREQAVAIYGEN